MESPNFEKKLEQCKKQKRKMPTKITALHSSK